MFGSSNKMSQNSFHSFDLVISLATLHNLNIFDLEKAVCEIERVGKRKYIMLESYRNDKELFNLQCWALTCKSFFSKDEWIWLYKKFMNLIFLINLLIIQINSIFNTPVVII